VEVTRLFSGVDAVISELSLTILKRWPGVKGRNFFNAISVMFGALV
jgi:hypothetical protein